MRYFLSYQRKFGTKRFFLLHWIMDMWTCSALDGVHHHHGVELCVSMSYSLHETCPCIPSSAHGMSLHLTVCMRHVPASHCLHMPCHYIPPSTWDMSLHSLLMNLMIHWVWNTSKWRWCVKLQCTVIILAKQSMAEFRNISEAILLW